MPQDVGGIFLPQRCRTLNKKSENFTKFLLELGISATVAAFTAT
jgi:hypothetical protein